MIIPVIIVAALAAALIVLARGAGARSGGTGVTEEQWEVAAQASHGDRIASALIAVARPLAGAVVVPQGSTFYRAVSAKLAATGEKFYAGSVDLFVSVQVAAMLLSAGLIAGAVLFSPDAMAMAVVLLLALAISAAPYSQINEAAKKRSAAVRAELPAFAELLLMPVASGQGLISSLQFTVAQSKGVVADEVRKMLALINSRSMPEAQAFAEAGASLGDASAIAFFNALYQAYEEGVPVAQTLRAQAEALRHQQHQEKRAAMKKLPNTVVVIMAVHLMPFIFIVVAIPTLVAMAGL